jgi:hypothetical protein
MPVPIQTSQNSQNFTYSGGVTKTVTTTFGSAITVGNVLFVVVGGTSPEPGGISSPSVTDTLGNTFVQAAWQDGAGNDSEGVGIYYANITVGGTCTLSFSAALSSGFGTSTTPLAILAAEYPSFGTSVSVQSAATAHIISGNPVATITDSLGHSITTRGHAAAFNSIAVADFIPCDFLIATECNAGGADETVVPTSLSAHYRILLTDSLATLGFYVGDSLGTIPQIGLIT